jgi:hypothetical protein
MALLIAFTASCEVIRSDMEQPTIRLVQASLTAHR